MVVIDHVFHNREPEARPAGVSGAGRVTAIKALKNSLEVRFGNALTLIGHRYFDNTTFDAGADTHPGGGLRVGDGVSNQVVKSAHQ